MIPVLEPALRGWECPSCGHQEASKEVGPVSKLHPCPRLRGLMAPLVEVTNNHGIVKGKVRHVAQERGDYLNGEQGARFDDTGRAIMAVRTERSDGSNDCHVFPTAASVTTER